MILVLSVINRPAAESDEELRYHKILFDDLSVMLCTTMGSLIAMLAVQQLLHCTRKWPSQGRPEWTHVHSTFMPHLPKHLV